MTDGLMRRTWEDFRFHWRPSLGFHLVLQLLGVAILTPLIAGVGRLLVRASGGPVISNYDMVAFGLSPIGIAFIVVVAALTITLLLAEFAGQNWIAGHAVARRPVTVSSTIAFLVRKLPWLMVLSARVFLRAGAAGAAVPGGCRAGVVHDAARARHQLLPRRASTGVAARQGAGGGPGRRLRAGGRVATGPVALRDPDPHVQGRAGRCRRSGTARR